MLLRPAKRRRMSLANNAPMSLNLALLLDGFRTLPTTEQDKFISELTHLLSKRQLAFLANTVMPRLRMDILTMVPLEISLHILSFLPVKSLCRLARCSRAHRQMVEDSHLWRRLCHVYEFTKPKTGSSFNRSRSFHSSSLTPSGKNSDTASGVAGTTMVLRNRTISLPHLSGNGPVSPADSTDDLPAVTASRSSDYKNLFIAEYTIKRNWSTGQCAHFSIDGPRSAIVTCLQYDDEKLVIATDNASFGLIEVFDSYQGTRLKRLSGHEGGVWALDFIDDVLVSGGCDRDVRVWNIKTGEMLHRMAGHTSTVRCLRMIDETTCVTGSRDNSLRIWDIERGQCLRVMRGHTGSIRCLAVHDTRVVSGSYDNTLRIWDWKTGALLHTLDEHHAQIYSVAFDGRYVCSGSLDADVRVWSATTGECVQILEGHDALVGHMQLEGDTLVTGGSDGRVCVWNIEGGKLLHRIGAHVNSVTTLQFDDERILSGGDDGVKLWSMKSGELIRHVIDGASGVWRLQAGGHRLISAIQRGDLTTIEIMNFNPRSTCSSF